MSGSDPIHDEWFPVARASDIAAGRWLPFELLDERWVLACDNSGRVEVFVDTCPHRGARITLGDFDGERLRCGYHGWQFDIDGRCIHQPAHPERQPRRDPSTRSFSPARVRVLVGVCGRPAPEPARRAGPRPPTPNAPSGSIR